ARVVIQLATEQKGKLNDPGFSFLRPQLVNPQAEPYLDQIDPRAAKLLRKLRDPAVTLPEKEDPELKEEIDAVNDPVVARQVAGVVDPNTARSLASQFDKDLAEKLQNLESAEGDLRSAPYLVQFLYSDPGKVEDALDFMIWRHQAEQLGIRFSDA